MKKKNEASDGGASACEAANSVPKLRLLPDADT